MFDASVLAPACEGVGHVLAAAVRAEGGEFVGLGDGSQFGRELALGHHDEVDQRLGDVATLYRCIRR